MPTSRKSTREAIRIWRTSLTGRLILTSMDSDGKQLIIVYSIMFNNLSEDEVKKEEERIKKIMKEMGKGK